VRLVEYGIARESVLMVILHQRALAGTTNLKTFPG
jgi:hypothetical protein